jgi:hypothetical protein
MWRLLIGLLGVCAFALVQLAMARVGPSATQGSAWSSAAPADPNKTSP